LAWMVTARPVNETQLTAQAEEYVGRTRGANLHKCRQGSGLTLTAFAFSLALGAAMATRALLDVDHSFFTVRGNDAGLLMFMATVTGVAFVITAQMAGCAGGIVSFIKREEAVVIKRRRRPSRRLMAG